MANILHQGTVSWLIAKRADGQAQWVVRGRLGDNPHEFTVASGVTRYQTDAERSVVNATVEFLLKRRVLDAPPRNAAPTTPAPAAPPPPAKPPAADPPVRGQSKVSVITASGNLAVRIPLVPTRRTRPLRRRK